MDIDKQQLKLARRMLWDFSPPGARYTGVLFFGGLTSLFLSLVTPIVGFATGYPVATVSGAFLAFGGMLLAISLGMYPWRAANGGGPLVPAAYFERLRETPGLAPLCQRLSHQLAEQRRAFRLKELQQLLDTWAAEQEARAAAGAQRDALEPPGVSDF